MKKILVVHPETGVANMMAAALGSVHNVVCAATLDVAKKVFADQKPDGIIIAGREDGLEWASQLLADQQPYDGTIIGVVDSLTAHEEFTRLGCKSTDCSVAAVGMMHKALAA